MGVPGTIRATIAFTVNGEPAEAPYGLTLAGWLELLGRDPRTVAIEKNGRLVPRATFGATPLEAGDKLELVQFVQGG
jgi:thiamine biosynthesis protein ThiS